MFRRCAWASQVNVGWLSTEAISTEAIGTATISTEAIGTEALVHLSGSYRIATIWCILQKLLVQLSGSYHGTTIWCVLLVYWYSYTEAIVEQLFGVCYWCIGTATWSYCVIDWNIRGCGSEMGNRRGQYIELMVVEL